MLGGLWPLVEGVVLKPGFPPLTPGSLAWADSTGASPRGRGGGRGFRGEGVGGEAVRVPLCGEGLFYVPQRPYTAVGSLRDQIIYPLARSEAARCLAVRRRAELRQGGEGGFPYHASVKFPMGAEWDGLGGRARCSGDSHHDEPCAPHACLSVKQSIAA